MQVGNGVIDVERDGLGAADYLWTHALISDETYAPLHKCLESKNYTNCSFDAAYAEVGDIDPYDIYAPTCQNASSPVCKCSKRAPG